MALYAFAYYEWTIIYIVERLEPGFVRRYSRGRPMTARAVERRFHRILGKSGEGQAVSLDSLLECHGRFKSFVDERNALVHSHPVTDKDGAQILNYQARPETPISDRKWSLDAVEGFARRVDAAAIQAGEVLDEMRSPAESRHGRLE